MNRGKTILYDTAARNYEQEWRYNFNFRNNEVESSL